MYCSENCACVTEYTYRRETGYDASDIELHSTFRDGYMFKVTEEQFAILKMKFTYIREFKLEDLDRFSASAGAGIGFLPGSQQQKYYSKDSSNPPDSV